MNTGKNWMEVIDTMPRRRLEIFAIPCIGMLMSKGDGINKTPDQIFDEVYALGELDADTPDEQDDLL